MTLDFKPHNDDLQMGDLTSLVVGLEDLTLGELRALWRRRFGRPPALRSVVLMRLMLAWRIQAQAFGGLPDDVRRALDGRGPVAAEGLHLGVGARLRREWRGEIVEVVVEEHGFRWGETLYPSLSAAATAIAGSRWNGPRFFGLRNLP